MFFSLSYTREAVFVLGNGEAKGCWSLGFLPLVHGLSIAGLHSFRRRSAKTWETGDGFRRSVRSVVAGPQQKCRLGTLLSWTGDGMAKDQGHYPF